MTRTNDLERIALALDAASAAAAAFTSGAIEATMKCGNDPVTAADLAVNDVLRNLLPRSDEGWLSEETADSNDRLGRERVWIVDPIDGTREFIQGIPEWCISVGLIERGQPVAGGIHNPATGERIIGSIETGVEYTGTRPAIGSTTLSGAAVLASRSEVQRGEWGRYADHDFAIIPMGSIAYKLSLVAARRAAATWTLTPKHQWDVAAGAALVRAAGGWLSLPCGAHPTWNGPDPAIPGFVATSAALAKETAQLLGIDSSA